VNNRSSFGIPFATFAQTFACFAVKIKSSSVQKILSLILISFFTSAGFSQETKLSESIISIAEELAADDTDPGAIETYIERLNELAENPVKINSSSGDEFSRLFFLSDFQVKALADYAHSSGRIVSVFELATIPGFDKETAEMIIPFITLNYNQVNDSDSARWRNSFISNLSIRSAETDTTLLGSDWKSLTKYKFSAGAFSGGFTIEKDPGEKLITGNPPLPDFLSAHLVFRGNRLMRKIIIGDYSARFGQGTNINTGIRRGLSLSSPGYMSSSDELKPYTSTDENNFFRGIAAEFSLKNFALSMFISRKRRDATIEYLPVDSTAYITSFYQAGLHNTTSLLQKKDVFMESGYGINLSYNPSNLKIGFTWSENSFSLPVNLSGSDPSKVFDFKGVRHNLYSVYYNGFIKNILLYGEVSLSDNNKYAAIQGISMRPSDRLSINFLFRNYESGYITFHGNGPGSSSKTTNERGILGNFTYEAAKHLFISGGFDIHDYPWLKYRCSGPTRGIAREIRARYLPTEKVTFEVLFNYRLSMVNNSDSAAVPEQKELINRNVKGSVRYSISDNLKIGIRADFKLADPSGSKGTLLLQDVIYKFRKYPLSVWFRYCVFKTDDWDSRIYTYENDLLYSFSIPALSGKGSRSYLMVKWEFCKYAELRLKYGITSRITNGNTGINTDELKMQCRIWF
jgi:hypothetical protein